MPHDAGTEQISHQARCLRVRPGDAELDALTSTRLCRLLAAQDPRQHLVVDMGGVTFCDARGLGVLEEARRRHVTAGGSLRLVAVGPAVRRLLSICRLDDLAVVDHG